jgi:hypothetical protein
MFSVQEKVFHGFGLAGKGKKLTTQLQRRWMGTKTLGRVFLREARGLAFKIGLGGRLARVEPATS